MVLEHVGIAAADLAATLGTYRRLLGLDVYKTETVEREGVRTHFLDTGARLELLEALSPESPVARHIERRGAGVHHLAFRVPDVDAAAARLAAAGVPLLSETPKTGADGKRIVFLHPKATHGVLVELLSDDPDALPTPEWADTPAGRLAAYRFGARHDADGNARPAILVLHGAAGSTRLETLLLARLLEPTGHVVALDLPGHGQSSSKWAMVRSRSRARWARSSGRWTRSASRGRTSPGTASAARSALFLAALHPERVGRVAVHATNLVWDDATVAAMTRRLNPAVLARRFPDVWARFEAAHGGRSSDLFARVGAFTATIPAFAADAHALAARIAAPVLVTAGDRDELFSIDRTLALRDALPSAALGILPGHRHALTPEATRAVAPLVAAHLAG